MDNAKKGGSTDSLSSVESFLRSNLKVLEFEEYDLITPDEIVFNIGDNFKKDKASKLSIIGNSFICTFSFINYFSDEFKHALDKKHSS